MLSRNRFALWLDRHYLPASFGLWLGMLLLISMLGLVATRANAQAVPTATLTASPTSGVDSVDVTLTWSSTGATSCLASGGWSGTKATSGTQVVPAVKVSTNFALTCSAGTGAAQISWTAPTLNTNGTPLNDLAGYKVYEASSPAGLPTAVPVNAGNVTSYTAANLAAGPHSFAVTAYNTAGVESIQTTPVSLPVTAPSASATASVAVTTKPNPPAGVVVVNKFAWSMSDNWQKVALVRDSAVGTVPLGLACDKTRQLQSEPGYYIVPNSAVTWTTTGPRPSYVVAQCAPPAG